MPIRVAVVGTGGIARRHGAALREHPEAEIVAAVDVDHRKREVFVAEWGGAPYDSLSECLHAVDAVYVLTPPGFRREYALEAIEGGKHVFCEKPLAIDTADASAIVDAAERRDVIAMTGFNQRYRLGYRRLHEAVSSGVLGNPYHFFCQRFGMGAGATGVVAGKNWRTDQETLCGMTVESLSHDIDLIRWIMDDEISSVSAITFSTAENLRGFDNNSHVLLELTGGGSAVINASWSSRIGFNSRGVLGMIGTAFVSGTDIGNNGIWCSTEFHQKTDADEFERVEMLHDDLDGASYVAETADFMHSILTGAPPLVTVRDGYETVRISNAILEAANTRSVVKVR